MGPLGHWGSGCGSCKLVVEDRLAKTKFFEFRDGTQVFSQRFLD